MNVNVNNIYFISNYFIYNQYKNFSEPFYVFFFLLQECILHLIHALVFVSV